MKFLNREKKKRYPGDTGDLMHDLVKEVLLTTLDMIDARLNGGEVTVNDDLHITIVYKPQTEGNQK